MGKCRGMIEPAMERGQGGQAGCSAWYSIYGSSAVLGYFVPKGRSSHDFKDSFRPKM